MLESNLIVSEVQFEEGSRGGSHVIGQHVGEHGTCRPHIGSIFGSNRESRHVTLDNAKKKIGAVAAQLRLNKNCQDVAFTFYKRALQKRLTHGRKNTHVIAACIYITCRTETTSHMLLDLSDVMQVNVYELGRTYLKLSSALHIHIPAIDPCIYIVRFASKLDLAGKHHEIEMTAMRIAQRMKRDWMHFGRRPSGLCGSALLVAARLHDVHCSIKEIIRVVKVCEATIRKRLSEFGDTPTSKLTLDEFMSVDLEGEEDPPCFKAARKKKTQELNSKITSEEVTKQVSSLERQIEEELEKTRKTRRSPFASYASSLSQALGIEDDTGIVEEIVRTDMAQTVSDIIQGDEDQILPSASVLRLTETFGLCEPAPSSLPVSHLANKENALAVEKGCDNDEGSGELFTDDLDDNEIESYILDDNEAKIKRTVWEKVNADWIKESTEKAKRKAEEEAELKLKEEKGEVPVKKRRKVKKKNPIQANSAGEAIEKMLQEKRISNKINYDVLKQLSGHSAVTTPSDAASTTRESSESQAQGQEAAPPVASTAASIGAPVRRLPSIRNFVASHIRLPQRRTSVRLSSISSAGNSRMSEAVDQVADETRSSLRAAAGQEEGMPSSGNEELTTVSRDELPAASAPAAAVDEPETKEQFQGRGEQEEDDEDEEEEDEEDDQNQQMSIAQLMSQRTGVAVHDDDDHLADMTDHEEYD